jgi:hypothetical protein
MDSREDWKNLLIAYNNCEKCKNFNSRNGQCVINCMDDEDHCVCWEPRGDL